MSAFRGLPNTPARISQSLNRRLHGYALAASAAGVSALALSQSASADIVYTQTHQIVGANGIYPLDLNHDGVVDFLIHEWSAGYSCSLLAKEALGNAVQGSGQGRRAYAAALMRSAWIGPSQGFVRSGYNGEHMAGVEYSSYGTGRTLTGQWPYVTNRYLGLKFKIKGEIHYGWARLSVDIQGHFITATLTGYAYETIAKKRLRAGQETYELPKPSETAVPGTVPSSKRVAPESPPASLGILARGTEARLAGRQK